MPSCLCRYKLPTSLVSFGRVFGACLLVLMGFAGRAQATISFVQQNSSDPQSAQTTVTVPYTLAQTAGNLNVVIVGWNDATHTVSSVTDSKGNVYVLAVGPTVQSGTATQSIYYAKNIAAATAGSNTVTVTFNAAAAFPDIRIAEYAGIDPVNPVDGSIAAQGSTASSSSGAFTTTNANDLLVAANVVQTLTTGAGTGFTSRGITSPDGDILEDRIVTATGSYTGVAPVSPSGKWVMQMVAFRAAGSGGTTPSINSLNPTSGPVSTSVTITGTNFGGSQGTGTVTFNSTPAGTATNWNATTIVIPVPAGATTGNVIVTVGGVASNGVNFTVTGPPASVTASAGTPQSATINAAFATALQATVRDAGNNLLSGVVVTFTAPTSGASGTFAGGMNTATTNASGVATSAVFTANATAGGPYNVMASVTGATSANFSLTNKVGPAAKVAVTSGSGQSVAINTAFGAPLVATVTDAGNNPVSGVTVTFTAPTSGASGAFAGTNTALTNASGVATSNTFTANATAGGPYNVVASATGATSANFSLTNTAGLAAKVTVTSGSGQSATINTAFAAPLVATVTDVGNNPVSGVVVTLTAPGSGASGTFAGGMNTATTNASGVATSAVFTANATAGGPYNVVASATGATSANFSLTNLPTAAAIAFVQSNSATPAGSQTTVAVVYTLAQTAGNLNVVVVGWNDSTATVSSVVDSKGNTYAVAAAPVVQTGTATQAIYYAKNIFSAAAGTNTVTVTFSVAAVGPDIRIAEYTGVDPVNPLDVAVGAQGNSVTADSGFTTTTGANDLLIGANLVQTLTTGPGTGFTSRVITSPDGDILEDRVVSAVGSYDAAAPVSPSGLWIMQMAAFHAAGGASGTQPTAPTNLTATAASSVQINLSWTASIETGGTISQYLVERCAGVNCGNTPSNFVQVATPTTTTYSDLSLIGSTSYSYRVRAKDTLNVTGPYSAIATATTAAPTFTAPANLAATASGPVQVNLSWTAATETGGTITSYSVERCTGTPCNFAQIGSSPTTTYSDTSASLLGSTTYNYRVRATDGTNFSAYSNTASATTAAPTFTAPSNLVAASAGSTQISLSWSAATETGGTITSYLVEHCAGANCANTPNNFTPVGSSTTLAFTDTGLTTSTPYSYRVRATDGTNFSSYSNVATATPIVGPVLSALGLTQGPIGASITITGSGFGATQAQGSSTITFNGTPATATSWSDISVDTSVPAGATTGNVVITVGGTQSNPLVFTVTPPPNITGVNPNAGPIGTVVNVTGTNFGPTVGTRSSGLLFNGTVARTTSWSNTLIVAPVPVSATSGNVVVSVGGINSNGVPYTVTPGPNVASLSPTSGVVGTPVTISGAGFGASQGSSTITFNNVSAIPTSWSDTSIVAPVPTGATTGNVVVTNGGIASNGVLFTLNSGIIKLVQHTSKDAGTTTSSTLAFPSSNTAGNFIAVVIRAGQSGQVFTVSDSHANTYKQAVSFNMTVDWNTIGIFYAENILGGANTVTVSDTISGTLRFAILEYSGVTTANSLDATAVSQGTSTSPSSGNLATSLSGDLLLGEIATGDAETYTAGTGYKIEEFVPAEPNSKLIAEDQIQASAGLAAATATLGASDPWAAALAAFKSASGAPPPPISVSVSPNSAPVGTGGSQNFTATVQNDFQNRGATWSLSGAGCSGITCGSLTNVTATSVTYNGPASVPSPATVTLTATSISDNTKVGTATITVVLGPLNVTVSPKRAAVTMSTLQTVQFNGTVFNDPSNSGLRWSVDSNNGGTAASGTVSATGLYTPGTQPGVHIVTATSVANAAVSASSSVAVTDLAGVYTHHNDKQRTGQNLQEYALTPANVSSPAFTQLFSCPTDGYVYAQPLWVANLMVAGVNHNALFLATEHDSVYAYDADSPSCILLWKTSFLSNGVGTMPYTDIAPNATDDVFPEIGITSTPVIDPATNTIYVEAKTKETVGTGCSMASPCYIHRLHALDTTTGAEKFGGPKAISASGFSSLRHFNRPALLLNNGVVYIAFGSHGDNCNWQGWIFGYNATTLAQTFVWNTTNSSGCGGGAFWGGGAGPAIDAGGNLYLSTGNGNYDGTSNFGDTAVKLSPTGALLDWFTPFNESVFQANDIDLGSAGIIILPDSVGSTAHPHLAIATGKVAILYLLDADPVKTNMGKFNSSTNNDVQEVIPVPPPNTTQLDGGNYGIPAYWNGNIYTTGQNFPLSQFTIANGIIATPQAATSSNVFPPRGAIPGVSASGNTNGVVWILDLTAWTSSGSAILDAYDATNVSNLLFSSPSSGAGAAGPAVKFTIPTIANGKVYVGGQSIVTVFGLLPN
jgi:hypothetical protein